jgi:putrescine aminotransferase
MAKGLSSAYLPISAVGIGERINAALLTVDEDFEHGFTASAHPVCSAVALENIKVIEDDRLIEHVRDRLAPRLAHHLGHIADLPIVGETRQCGVLAAVELAVDKVARRSFPAEAKVGEACAGRAFAHGLIVRPIDDVLGLSLPMITSEDQVDTIAAILKTAITDVARTL